jgi:hypothetical protein
MPNSRWTVLAGFGEYATTVSLMSTCQGLRGQNLLPIRQLLLSIGTGFTHFSPVLS